MTHFLAQKEAPIVRGVNTGTLRRGPMRKFCLELGLNVGPQATAEEMLGLLATYQRLQDMPGEIESMQRKLQGEQ